MLKVKVFLGCALLFGSYAAVALNEYFNKMDHGDKINLEKFCVFVKSERAKIASKELLKKMELLEELQQKYPDLEFTNPCGL